jgi:hypothetical protein
MHNAIQPRVRGLLDELGVSARIQPRRHAPSAKDRRMEQPLSRKVAAEFFGSSLLATLVTDPGSRAAALARWHLAAADRERVGHRGLSPLVLPNRTIQRRAADGLAAATGLVLPADLCAVLRTSADKTTPANYTARSTSTTS